MSIMGITKGSILGGVICYFIYQSLANHLHVESKLDINLFYPNTHTEHEAHQTPNNLIQDQIRKPPSPCPTLVSIVQNNYLLLRVGGLSLESQTLRKLRLGSPELTSRSMSRVTMLLSKG